MNEGFFFLMLIGHCWVPISLIRHGARPLTGIFCQVSKASLCMPLLATIPLIYEFFWMILNGLFYVNQWFYDLTTHSLLNILLRHPCAFIRFSFMKSVDSDLWIVYLKKKVLKDEALLFHTSLSTNQQVMWMHHHTGSNTCPHWE